MVLLGAGESILKQGPVTRINPQANRDGVLTVTNVRVIFEVNAAKGPQGEPIVKTTIDAPLRRVRNAVVAPGGGSKGRLELELPQQRALFQTAEADAWLQVIVQARANAPIPAGGPGGGGGAPAVVLRCRYCGTLNPPTVSKCTGCGAPV